VVDGRGLSVRVERGHLEIADGLGRHRRIRRYARATHGLARLVIIGASGMASLEALKWCAGVGIPVVVIDPADGTVLSTSGGCAFDDGRIRRAQALAPGTETGMAVARYLIGVKLAGQAQVASAELGSPTVTETIVRLAEQLADTASLEEIRQLEAAAANVYWNAWGVMTVQYAKRDTGKVPKHWKTFDGRRSAVNPGSARSATEPVNALLNYSYRLVEAEGRLATLSLGLDPGLGILHADMRNRDGFVLDLIEACRPIADRHVARLIKGHVFRRMDFGEDARGIVRLLPPLSHRLTEAMPSYGAALAPYAEHVATLLGNASPYDVTTPSVLTKAKHKEAARRRAGSDTSPGGTRGTGPNTGGMAPRTKFKQHPKVQLEASLPLPLCITCGGLIPMEEDRDRPRGRYCASCLAERRKELGVSLGGQSARTSADLLVRTGVRPTHTPESKLARQAGNVAQRAIQAAWEADHAGEAHNPAWFTQKVLPGLQGVSLTTIAKATGMSTSSASKVRAGRRVPHPRHWEALGENGLST
jgi:CRISPR-associated endonuclease Cas1